MKEQATESIEKEGTIVEVINRDEKNRGENFPNVKRAKYDSLTLFEVSEEELNIIEKGSPSSLYLTFGIALLSICISFLSVLLTVKFTVSDSTDLIKFIIFLLLCICCGLIGTILMIIWYRSSSDSKEIIQKIRCRMKE